MPRPHTLANPFLSRHRTRLRTLALVAVVPLALLCVASVFGMQAGAPALSHAWRHADASLPMIALATLVVGPLLAFCVGD